MGKFIIKKTDNGNFNFTLFAPNKEKIAVASQVYTTKQACKNGIASVGKFAEKCIAENKIEDVVKKLNLEEVVRQQVNTFPVQKLEELVLGISKREFKMITMLGFVLGGLIGVIQGLFAVFV